jgi:hypothetical protein
MRILKLQIQTLKSRWTYTTTTDIDMELIPNFKFMITISEDYTSY